MLGCIPLKSREGEVGSLRFGLVLTGIICELSESLFSLGLVSQAASLCCSFSMSGMAIYLPIGMIIPRMV